MKNLCLRISKVDERMKLPDMFDQRVLFPISFKKQLENIRECDFTELDSAVASKVAAVVEAADLLILKFPEGEEFESPSQPQVISPQLIA